MKSASSATTREAPSSGNRTRWAASSLATSRATPANPRTRLCPSAGCGAIWSIAHVRKSRLSALRTRALVLDRLLGRGIDLFRREEDHRVGARGAARADGQAHRRRGGGVREVDHEIEVVVAEGEVETFEAAAHLLDQSFD